MERLSQLALRLKGQEMFQILAKTKELEREGKEIIHFEIGDPNFDTPENVVNAAREALTKGHTHYSPSSGIFELKVAAADVTAKSRGFRPELNQLLVAPANYQIRLALGCVVNPGDEVIIPDPSFVSYGSLINNIPAKAVRIPLKEENEFRLNPDDVEKAITDKTKMIIINSPNNPTGSVMTEEEIRRIYEIAKQKDIYLLSDEVYARILYQDAPEDKFHSPSKYDFCRERVIVVNGFSKAYAMTGWRIGVCTGPSELIEKMGLLLESEISCVSTFIQRAAIEALKGSQEKTFEMRDEYRKRRDFIVNELNAMPGIRCVKPKGAFYVFPNITRTGMNDEEFRDFMLDEAGVALCNGTMFGEYGQGYVRLCYANCSFENIKIGMERMKYALEKKIWKKREY